MATHIYGEDPAARKPRRNLFPIGTLRTASARRDLPAGRYHRLAAALTLAIASTTALTACGSSNSTSAAATGAGHSPLAAARCMRTHGVPNFPDPGRRGGMTVLLSPGSSTVTIDGILFTGPAFQAAEKVCQPLGDRGSGNPPVPEQQRRALLDFAECMRHHGIPYSDPTFPAGGGIFGGGPPSQDANSPAVKHAATICNKAMRSIAQLSRVQQQSCLTVPKLCLPVPCAALSPASS